MKSQSRCAPARELVCVKQRTHTHTLCLDKAINIECGVTVAQSCLETTYSTKKRSLLEDMFVLALILTVLQIVSSALRQMFLYFHELNSLLSRNI